MSVTGFRGAFQFWQGLEDSVRDGKTAGQRLAGKLHELYFPVDRRCERRGEEVIGHVLGTGDQVHRGTHVCCLTDLEGKLLWLEQPGGCLGLTCKQVIPVPGEQVSIRRT